MAKIKIRREARIGIFSVAMIAVLYWGINFIKGTDLIRGTKTYYAVYDHVGGLQPSSPVVINGYKVGVVQKMSFDPDKSHKIVLQLRIKSRFNIPDNSSARMFSDGLMGGKAIEIVMGDSETYLDKGDTLFSKADKDLLEMAGSEMEYIKAKANAIVNQITATLSTLNAILAENQANIATTLGNVASISTTLDGVVSAEAKDLEGTIRNLNSLSRSLAAAGPKVDGMVANMETLSKTLASPKIPQAVDDLSSGMASLEQMLARVNSGQGTAGKLLNDQALYDSLCAASSSLNLLLEDLKTNPKRYVHFSLFGGGKNK